MKMFKNNTLAIVAALALASSSAFAGFGGWFTGYYAPASWTADRDGNPIYAAGSSVQHLNNDYKTLFIYGAVSENTLPDTPASDILYWTTLDGSGPQPVIFKYSFFTDNNPAGDDNAYFYWRDADLHTIPLVGSGTFTMTLTGGTRFGFLVTSDNDSFADVLQINPVPEPSTLALFGLGMGAVLWQWRRKHAAR